MTGGSIQAYGVVTVLPMITAPASRRLATTVGIGVSNLVHPTLGSRKPSANPHIDDVFDADWNPMQRAAIVAAFQLSIQ